MNDSQLSPHNWDLDTRQLIEEGLECLHTLEIVSRKQPTTLN